VVLYDLSRYSKLAQMALNLRDGFDLLMDPYSFNQQKYGPHVLV